MTVCCVAWSEKIQAVSVQSSRESDSQLARHRILLLSRAPRTNSAILETATSVKTPVSLQLAPVKTSGYKPMPRSDNNFRVAAQNCSELCECRLNADITAVVRYPQILADTGRQTACFFLPCFVPIQATVQIGNVHQRRTEPWCQTGVKRKLPTKTPFTSPRALFRRKPNFATLCTLKHRLKVFVRTQNLKTSE